MRLVSKWKHGTYRFRWRCESRCWSFGALKDFVGVHSAVIRNCQRDCSAPDKCVSVADNGFCSQQLRADVRHQELTLDIVIMHTRHNILSLMFCHSNTISSVIFDRHFLRLFPIFQTLCMVPSLCPALFQYEQSRQRWPAQRPISELAHTKTTSLIIRCRWTKPSACVSLSCQ